MENSPENLHAIGNGFKFPYLAMRLMPARFLTGFQAQYGISFLKDLLMEMLLNPEGTLGWDSSITPQSDDFFSGDLQGIIDHPGLLARLGHYWSLSLFPIFESTSNHKSTIRRIILKLTIIWR